MCLTFGLYLGKWLQAGYWCNGNNERKRMNAKISLMAERMARSDFLFEGLLFQDFLQGALDLLDVQYGYFHRYDSGQEVLKMTVWSWAVIAECSTSHQQHYPLERAGIWADCIRQERAVIHNNYANASGRKGLPQGHFVLQRHLGMPFRNEEGQVCGVLGAANRERPFDLNDVALLEAYCAVMCPLLRQKLQQIEARRQHGFSELERTSAQEILIQMLAVVCKSLSLRDEYTASHGENVAQVAQQIGREMGLPEDQVLGLRLGGLVHDLGKIGMPLELLNKPGRLTPVERALLQTHAAAGASLFQHLAAPWPLAQMAGQHHERLDGSGYPLGLRNEQIIFEARVIMVADVFDSMVTDRPYRFAPGIEAGLAELRQGRGILYDPYVVDALIAAWEGGRIAVPQRSARETMVAPAAAPASPHSVAQTV